MTSLFRRRISAGLILIVLVFSKVKANTIRKNRHTIDVRVDECVRIKKSQLLHIICKQFFKVNFCARRVYFNIILVRVYCSPGSQNEILYFFF